MSTTDDLHGQVPPARTDESEQLPSAGEKPRAGRATDNLVRAAYVFFAVALGVAVYLVVTRDGGDGSDTAADLGPSSTTAGDSVSTTSQEPADSIATSAPTAEAAAAPSVTTTAPPTSNSASTPASPVELQGVLDGERVIITGVASSEDAATAIAEAVSELLPGQAIEAALTIEADAPVPTSLTITVADSVGFDPGSATISPDFYPLLDRLADVLAVDTNVSLIVSGHADADGDRVVNLALSQRRADAARDYLVERGINQYRVEALGRGDTEPIADNDTFDGRIQNRRIEFELRGLRFDVDG